MLTGWKRLFRGFRRGYVEDMLDKSSITGEDEHVDQKEHDSKGVEDCWTGLMRLGPMAT